MRRISEVDGQEVKGDLDRYVFINLFVRTMARAINQRPIVEVGDRVKKGEVFADGPSMEKGELSFRSKCSCRLHDMGRI